ncbi:chromate transporter [Deinococcus aquatilis]|jgi:chromate transporter|uniref:chromate transporter n=1 Tax=Deinococcus aquatilis TaxID=519440 RepID=UPI00035E0FC9|nr:chromate transporter [Deinococcus aquatilis]
MPATLPLPPQLEDDPPQATRPQAALPLPPTPLQLARAFVGVALAGIGGGIPAHTRRAMLNRGWLDNAEFAEAFTLAQLTPGPNGVNLAAMVGARLGGKRGALASTLGVLTPGLIAMTAVTVLLLGLPGGLPPALQSALRGAACAALAVMLTMVGPIVRVGWNLKAGRLPIGAAVTLLTFVALGVLRLDLLPVLVVLVGAGLVAHRPAKRTHDNA